MKALIFLLLAINTQLWAANDNNIDIQKLKNQKAFIGQINQCMNSDQLDQFIKKAIQKTSDQEERSKYEYIRGSIWQEVSQRHTRWSLC